MKTAVISDGAWGTALALLLLENGHRTVLWSPFENYAEEMSRTRKNTRFLPGVALNPSLEITGDMDEAAAEAELIVLASPSKYLRKILEQLSHSKFQQDAFFINVAKGIEENTLKRMSELVFEYLKPKYYAALSGPSHAEEVAEKVPTAVVAASARGSVAVRVQQAFMNPNFRVYTSKDVTGVELGGALKNVYAIAVGIIDGMELGDNPKAALMTRAITEMARLGTLLGGDKETFSGLSGIGDLIVTCTSEHSRNRHVGFELGRGKKLDDILRSMDMVVAEGVTTCRSAYQLSRKIGAETPIIDQAYAVLYDNKSPQLAVEDLMTRKARPERDMKEVQP